MNEIKDELIRLLFRAMQSRGISFERAGAYIGCSGAQVHRWINETNKPSVPYRRLIEEGIKKISQVLPRDEHPGRERTGRSARHGPPTETPEEEKIYSNQFPSFFNALCRKVDKETREEILFNDAYLHGFQEILFLALKYKVKLPTLEKRI